MEIRAYSELYVENAQSVMGHMFDFAINTVGLDAEDFTARFLVSGYSKEIARGNITYIAGKTGPELVRLILKDTGYTKDIPEDVMYLDKSREYWGGWGLAYYQWLRDYSFSHILDAVSFSDILGLYPIFHEMDMSKFVDEMDRRLKECYRETSLKRIRKLRGYSQSCLASRSGVPLRQIQLFEQRRRDIRKAQSETVLLLSKALSCDMESLLV